MPHCVRGIIGCLSSSQSIGYYCECILLFARCAHLLQPEQNRTFCWHITFNSCSNQNCSYSQTSGYMQVRLNQSQSLLVPLTFSEDNEIRYRVSVTVVGGSFMEGVEWWLPTESWSNRTSKVSIDFGQSSALLEKGIEKGMVQSKRSKGFSFTTGSATVSVKAHVFYEGL